MTALYTRSTDGSDADNGTTWALAKATLTGVAAIDNAGDDLWVSQNHAETTASAVTIALAGTIPSPTRLLCGNDGAEPPTALATTGSVATTGASNLALTGSLYCYGITFSCGNSSGSALLLLNNTSTTLGRYESCKFILASTGATNQIRAGLNGGANIRVEWKNCDVKFANAGQMIQVNADFYWNGGTGLSGTSTPTFLFGTMTSATTGANVLVENVDLSNFSAGMHLVNAVGFGNGSRVVFRNCKMPAAWSGNLVSGTLVSKSRAAMYNCSDGSTNYKLAIDDYAGTIRDETTFVRSGGASDGTTPLAWKMVSSANTSFPLVPLASDEIVIWNETTGSAKTVTVEILRDSATNLKDNEVWLELQYLGSGSTLGVQITDAVADVLATAADQTASSVTWVTSGMSNPNKQKLSVTFTPQKKGFFIARVMLAKVSTTIYVDPKLTVT